jgi:fatty acid desaturase
MLTEVPPVRTPMKPPIPPALYRRRPVLFAARLCVYIMLSVMAVSAMLVTDGVTRMFSQVCYGIVLAYGVELSHQCIHRSGFASRLGNKFAGTALNVVAGRSFAMYRFTHFQHHRCVGTERDGERTRNRLLYSTRRTARFRGFVGHFMIVGSHVKMMRYCALALSGRLSKMLSNKQAVPSDAARAAQLDYLWILAFAGTLLLLSWVSHTDLLVRLWLVPLAAGYGPAHAAIILPEHFMCARQSADPFCNTRSIRAGRIMQWVTNFNSHHVGHHAYSTVPLENLPLLERILRQDRQFAVERNSYAAFYKSFLRHIWNGSGVGPEFESHEEC